MAVRRMPAAFIVRLEASVPRIAPQNWAENRRPAWASFRCQVRVMIGRMGPSRVLTTPVRTKPRWAVDWAWVRDSVAVGDFIYLADERGHSSDLRLLVVGFLRGRASQNKKSRQGRQRYKGKVENASCSLRYGGLRVSVAVGRELYVARALYSCA
jgi:hypothetical protein